MKNFFLQKILLLMILLLFSSCYVDFGEKYSYYSPTTPKEPELETPETPELETPETPELETPETPESILKGKYASSGYYFSDDLNEINCLYVVIDNSSGSLTVPYTLYLESKTETSFTYASPSSAPDSRYDSIIDRKIVLTVSDITSEGANISVDIQVIKNGVYASLNPTITAKASYYHTFYDDTPPTASGMFHFRFYYNTDIVLYMIFDSGKFVTGFSF